MHLSLMPVAGLIAIFLVSACSQTETRRTDESVESDTGAADSSASETDQVIDIIEERIRSSYEERGISVESAEISADPSGDYSGEAVVIDPTNNARVTLYCTATGVDGGAEDINCTDARPDGGQTSVTEVDVALQSTNPAAMRDEIISEMTSTLNGAGRTNRLVDYSRQGETVSAIFETLYAEGNRSVESRCSGTLRTTENGERAFAYTCRRPL
jgi:hypothetical protein